MKLIRTAFVSTSKHFTATVRKNRGHLRINVLFLSAMILTGGAWVALAELPEEYCSPTNDPKGCRISGQVTVQGRPISQGQILFSCQTIPIEYVDDSLEIKPVTVPIIHGKYGISEDHPLTPGLYLVKILTPEEPAATPGALPIWCDPSESAVRMRVGRPVLIQINSSSTQTFDFELEAGGQASFRDLH